MVLVKRLTDEEIARHQELIRQYFSEVRGQEYVEIQFHGNGSEKGVYKVKSDDGTFLAAAGARDKNRRLLAEYNALHSLYGGAPEFFPRPIAHYSPEQVQDTGDLFLMEFLPHLDLMHFDRRSYTPEGMYFRDLASAIGKGVSIVHAKTGMYPSEPHDGNILVRLDDNGELDLRFCDAIQFREGSIQDAVDVILSNNRDERPESFRFIRRFRQGLAQGTSQVTGVPLEKAYDSFEFLRRYNDIF